MLEAIPGWTWDWDPTQAAWDRGVAELRAYVAQHGTAAVPAVYLTAAGYKLGSWVTKLRGDKRNGRLSAERAAILETIPGWVWENPRPAWARGIAALRAYAAEHGTAAVPQKYRTADGFRLGSWVTKLRGDKRNGRLSAEQAAILEAIPGWVWDFRAQAWEEGLSLLRAYVAEHGTAAVPGSYRTSGDFALGTWVESRRGDLKVGRLPAERKAILESLPGWHW